MFDKKLGKFKLHLEVLGIYVLLSRGGIREISTQEIASESPMAFAGDIKRIYRHPLNLQSARSTTSLVSFKAHHS